MQDILHAYSWNEQTDKEVLLAILKAKAAEDQVWMTFLLLTCNNVHEHLENCGPRFAERAVRGLCHADSTGAEYHHFEGSRQRRRSSHRTRQQFLNPARSFTPQSFLDKDGVWKPQLDAAIPSVHPKRYCTILVECSSL